MKEMSSRDRMLNTLDLKTADRIPCCFMSFTALRKRCNEDMYELSKAERSMELDSMLFIPSASRQKRPEHPELRGLPVRFHPDVTSRTWRENDLLHREYDTPGGKLNVCVQISDDWPHGDHLPFVDDFQIPRAVKNLVTGAGDLEALQFLLTPPSEEDIMDFKKESERAQIFTHEQGVILTGGWGVGCDMANWLCGMQNLMMLSITDSGFVDDVLEMIHQWNMKRMEVVLEAPIDLYIRRAWYEGCDFVMPDFFKSSVLPRLKKEIELAHEKGARFGYICTSGTKPMIDFYIEAGIDVLIGVDPVQGTHIDMKLLKEKTQGRMCLWGGVSGAITVERGTEQEIRTAVKEAIDTLGPNGFILSPIDNITVDVPRTWENINIFKDAWHKEGVNHE